MTIEGDYGYDIQRKLYIDGTFVSSSDGGTFDVFNPSTGKILAEVASARPEDVDAAVRAADRQFRTGAWSRMDGRERGRLLDRLAALVERDKEWIAKLESLDNGKLFGVALNVDVPNLVATLRYFAALSDKLFGHTIPTASAFGRPTLTYTVREPLGVIGALGAYNAPTMYVGWKCAPALAAGNTVVYKPAEEAPLTTLYLAKLFDEAGFPSGTFNVVSGLGPIIGPEIVRHPKVAKVSYTGGGEVGKLLAKEAAALLKPMTLELGGKAPAIVLEDASLDETLPMLILGLFANQGQICAASTRVLVHRSLREPVIDGLAAAARAMRLGDALDPDSTLGPLTTKRCVDRVLRYIERGVQQGAKLITGGKLSAVGSQFVEPTIFAGSNDMTIAQEEIFGPVGIVIPFDSHDEAVEMANNTRYGLSAGIFTRDISHANVLARRIEAGTVWINGFGLIDPAAPWGGVKQSGYGRENGSDGLSDVTYEKVISTLL
ncbi:aldehyde dehydrogenase family protein [Burkholderia cenocepacia]|uniref:aldehyde dehydrogenase family protein n=1 Tax=Burkholderia cenocepacia TaxID=95486 RepID=UPI00286280C5|nr:aldehyde dehydrogenase family protein [Burkholderia cenocepacia]MDR5645477.1 aldehyde dehydrogenase family protein [Burkholderia cenocepacia]